MKKIFSIVCIAAMSLVSCSQFDDVALWNKSMNIESRLLTLEELCEQMNTNISSLQVIVTAVQENDYVTAVTPIYEGGKEVGYRIDFTKSASVTIYHGKDGANGTNGKDGKAGYTPTIGVKQDTDGHYYWTLDGDWLTDDSDSKIKAEGRDGENGKDGQDGQNGQNGQSGADGKDGITPQFKIEDGDWYISTDEGLSWQYLGRATGENGQNGTNGKDGGDSFFRDVDTSDPDYVIFTLADGTELKLPKYSQLTISFDTDDVLMIARNATKSVTYTIVSNISDIEIEVLSSSDVKTKVVKSSKTKGVITVTTGNYIDEDSHVLVLVSNGEKTIIKRLDIKIDLEIPELMEQMFPDPNFRQYVLDNLDKDKDGKISQDEAQKVTSIYCPSKSIKSLDGIQYFPNLKSLYCYSNQLTSLDVSQNTALTTLECRSNLMTSLDVSKNTTLTTLNCDSNLMTSLDVSKNTALITLYCSSNQLTTLDISKNTALTELNCDSNQLTSLDVSKNTVLTWLCCFTNQLTDLDLSQNTALKSLWCYSNQLTDLDVSQNTELITLRCYSNQLTSLDVSKNTALNTLECESNQLTSLDVSKNTALRELKCQYNQLTSLDVSKNTALTELRCFSNPLTTIYMKQGQTIADLSKPGSAEIVYVE